MAVRAREVLGPQLQQLGAEKAQKRFRVPERLASSEFRTEVDLAKRIAKDAIKHFGETITKEGRFVPTALSEFAHRAHEEPRNAHHNGPHSDRYETTLEALLLRATTGKQRHILTKAPEILIAAFKEARGHDFYDQVLTAQRNLEEGLKLSTKQAHDTAAGVVFLLKQHEDAQMLKKTYADKGISVDEGEIDIQARNAAILATIMSSPHGIPKVFEKTITQRGKKAYEWQMVQDPETQESSLQKVPKQIDAQFVAEYRAGDLDPFSLTENQHLFLAQYEKSHPNKGAVKPGESTYGLHPLIEDRYADRLMEITDPTNPESNTPFEDLLGTTLMKQRATIETVAMLGLLADTGDQVSAPTGRVVRSLLTQKTFNQDNPRPLWNRKMTFGDIPQAIEAAFGGNGNDALEGVTDKSSYMLLTRLNYETANWCPFTGGIRNNPEIAEMVGEIGVIDTLRHFDIIRAFMDPNPEKWTEPLDEFYAKRVEKYTQRMSRKRQASHKLIGPQWIRDEKQEVIDTCTGLPNAGEYTDQDFAVFEEYKKQTLARLQRELGVSDEQMRLYTEKYNSKQIYRSPYFKSEEDYDVVMGDITSLRGIEI